MIRTADNVAVIMCPQCRSEYVVNVVTHCAPIPYPVILSRWSDAANVSKAIKSAVPLVNGLCILPYILAKDNAPKEFAIF
jgi:hypothetical protein